MEKRIILAGWHWGEVSGTATVLENIVRHLEPSPGMAYRLVVPHGRELGVVPGFVQVARLGEVSGGHGAWLEAFQGAYGNELLFFPGMQLPQRTPARFVSVIHDVLPLHSIDFKINPLRAAGYRAKIRAHRTARRIITVSQFSRNDIVARCGLAIEKFRVVPNGVEDRFSAGALPIDGAVAALREQGPYALYVGDLSWRKNVPAFAKAYLALPPRLKEKYRFVFTGKGPARRKIENRFQRAGCAERLTALGVVDHELLPPLMAGASLFVFPSLLEGFGLPVLEAQAAGTPVLCNAASSLPEISGGAAHLVDTGSPRPFARALAFLLGDEGERHRLAEAGRLNAARYSWARSARAYTQIFQEALEGS
ncbi:MAG: glycosyltransferase family 4 protein [Spirochaetes bacterium]|nr:glycosyltransferase family 4 protein [Spirochaetota bacterium]